VPLHQLLPCCGFCSLSVLPIATKQGLKSEFFGVNSAALAKLRLPMSFSIKEVIIGLVVSNETRIVWSD
jgi:hypothetical protein